MNFILALLLQLCLLTHSQYCRSSYALEYSNIDCIFDYSYTEPNCTQFNFEQCNWIECVHWKQVDDDTVCDRTQIFYDYSWSYCTRQCCGNSAAYPYSYDSVQECQAYLDEQHKLAIIIIGSICGGLVLLGLIYAACKGISQKCDCDCDFGDCLQTCMGVLCFCCCLCLKGAKRIHHSKHQRHHHDGLNSTLTE